MTSEAKIRITAKDDSSVAFGQARANLQAMQGAAVNAIGALAGIGISLAGFTALAKATIDGVDALNDLKDATGSSIENISALEDVALRTGTSFDTVSTSLIKFNKVLADSKPGSDAEAALAAIGLKAEELKKIDPAEALLKTAQALSGFADDQDKARLVQELFGKSLKEVAPLLKDLAEKGQLVATVTTAQAEEAEKFNKGLFELQKNLLDGSRTIINSFLPALVALSGEFAAAIKTSNGFWDAIKAQLATNPFKSASENADVYRNSLERLNKTRERFVRDGRDTSGIDEIIAKDKRRLDYFNTVQLAGVSVNEADSSDALARKLKSGVRASVKFDGAVKPIKAKATAEAKDLDDTNKQLAQYVATLQRATTAAGELNEVEKANQFLKNQGSGANASQRELILSIAAQIDKEKELTEVLKLNREAAAAAGDAVIARNEKYQATLASLLAATPTANLEKQREEVKLLTEEFEAGRLAENIYLEAVTARLDLTGEKLKATKSIAEELGLTFTSSFEEAIAAGKDLQGVLQAIGQDIAKLVLRKTVTEPASKYLSKGIDSIFGDLFSGLGFAAGGSPPVGQFSVVGEKGPELFMPTVPGTIVPNSQLGGSVTYVFNGGVSRAEVMSGLQQVRAAAVGDVVDGQKRRRF